MTCFGDKERKKPRLPKETRLLSKTHENVSGVLVASGV